MRRLLPASASHTESQAIPMTQDLSGQALRDCRSSAVSGLRSGVHPPGAGASTQPASTARHGIRIAAMRMIGALSVVAPVPARPYAPARARNASHIRDAPRVPVVERASPIRHARRRSRAAPAANAASSGGGVPRPPEMPASREAGHARDGTRTPGLPARAARAGAARAGAGTGPDRDRRLRCLPHGPARRGRRPHRAGAAADPRPRDRGARRRARTRG